MDGIIDCLFVFIAVLFFWGVYDLLGATHAKKQKLDQMFVFFSGLVIEVGETSRDTCGH